MVFLTIRLALAAVFAIAAIAKLVDRRGSEQAVSDLGLPQSIAPFLAWAIPIAELAIAIALLPARVSWWGSLAAFGLLAAFTLAIAINLLNGRAPDCHCFGQLHSGPIGSGTLARNLILVMLAGLLALVPVETGSVSAISWFTGMTAGERALTIIGSAVVALLIAVVVLMARLLRQNERLTAALAESRIPFDEAEEPVIRKDLSLPSIGLPVGAPAPRFQLTDLDGAEVGLDDLLQPRLPVALIFVSPKCGPCAAMLPDIARWQEKYGEILNFALISSGSRDDNHQKFGGAERVLLQSDSEVSALFDAKWTPAAVILKSDGSIASPLANGSEAIRRAIIRTLTVSGSGDSGLSAGPNGHGQDSSSRIGKPAPHVSLPDLDGATVSLEDFRGERILVVFWSPDCTFCEQMLDELRRFEAAPPDHAPRLLVISDGSVEANRAAGLQCAVLLDDGFDVGTSFGATGTPSGVLVDADGNIASEVVSSASRVLALAGVHRTAQKV